MGEDSMLVVWDAATGIPKKTIFEPHPENILLETDRSYISRILDNLISNAIKFSQSGTKVWVSTLNREGAVGFSVKDEGPGISPQDQEKMFRKFQKLSARPTAGEGSNGL